MYSYSAYQQIFGEAPQAKQIFEAQGKTFPALPSSEWLPSLGQPPLGPNLGSEVPNLNLRNAYKADDSTQTPIQFLYEAANCLLTTVTSASALKSWGLKMVKRCGAKRARTAVARKLAVLLLRLWKQESHFEAQSA